MSFLDLSHQVAKPACSPGWEEEFLCIHASYIKMFVHEQNAIRSVFVKKVADLPEIKISKLVCVCAYMSVLGERVTHKA